VPLKLAEAAARVDGSVTRLEDALAQWAHARLNGHIDDGQPFEPHEPLLTNNSSALPISLSPYALPQQQQQQQQASSSALRTAHAVNASVRPAEGGERRGGGLSYYHKSTCFTSTKIQILTAVGAWRL
jgi:hypothetical protein